MNNRNEVKRESGWFRTLAFGSIWMIFFAGLAFFSVWLLIGDLSAPVSDHNLTKASIAIVLSLPVSLLISIGISEIQKNWSKKNR